MCPLEHYGLGRSYTALVGHAFDKNDELPDVLCYECAHRLDTFKTFRKRGRRAYAVLQGLLEEHGEISAESLRKIDVSQVGLAPSLLWCTLKPVIIAPVFNDEQYFTSKLEEGEPGMDNIEVNTDSKPETNLSDNENSPSPEPCVDKLDHNVTFIPGPTGEDCSPEPEKTQQNERKPKLGKVTPKRKRVTKNGPDGKKETREDGPNKVKRVRKVKTQNGDDIVPPTKKNTKANKVKDDVTQTVHSKKKRVRARPVARPRAIYTAEYYDRFATVTVLTDEQVVEVFSQRQNSQQYKKSPYQCTDCYRGFITRMCYDTHRKRHDDPSQGSEVCKICKVRLKDVKLLKKHIAEYHRTKFECKKCLFICTTSFSARLHESTHAEKHYSCASCSLDFKSPYMYQMHQGRLHPTLLACPVCGHTYPGQGAVNRHLNNTHHRVLVRGECTVLCECSALFLSKEARGVHRSSHPQHADLDGNTCAIYCDFCEQQFPDLPATLSHRGSHVQVLLPLQSREFKESNAYYNVNLRSHTKKKPYQCNICNIIFSTKYNLDRHGIVHTDDAPFICDICGKCYKHKNAIRYHILHVHLKKPWPKRDRSKRNQKTSESD